jgi:hypothetical protein
MGVLHIPTLDEALLPAFAGAVLTLAACFTGRYAGQSIVARCVKWQILLITAEASGVVMNDD